MSFRFGFPITTTTTFTVSRSSLAYSVSSSSTLLSSTQAQNFHAQKMSLSITPLHVSFSKSISSTAPLFLSTSTTNPSFLTVPGKTTVIRMGGGPRTFPGGVSKWQWKRMQAKKAKQLLKARLSRERQIYEMRKRAELKAAVSELERPWEVVERAPNLFSVDADEQLKVLADRFQRPGGFDLWSDQDGPEIFKTHDGIPSTRFFPKGVVHSIKPYGKVLPDGLERDEDDEKLGIGNGSEGEGSDNRGTRNTNNHWGRKGQGRGMRATLATGEVGLDRKQRGGRELRGLVQGNGGSFSRGRGLQDVRDSGRGRSDGRVSRTGGMRNSRDSEHGGSKSDWRISRSRGLHNSNDSGGEFYDMSLQTDGRYEFLEKNEH